MKPEGDIRPSMKTSLGVSGIMPSSSICTEYDSATAKKKAKSLFVTFEALGSWLCYTKKHLGQTYLKEVASSYVLLQVLGTLTGTCHSNYLVF